MQESDDMRIDVGAMSFKDLNQRIKESPYHDVELYSLEGQRYIGTGLKNRKIGIHGVPGNAMGAFLDGGTIEVFSSAQDAIGDTMNDGVIIVHGSAGDAAGYAMRGGKIYIRDSAGYRAGIHMKAYKDKQPLLIIGDSAGSFLGEYQAGGTIIVLGLEQGGTAPVGYFCGTGMHGGRIILRSDTLPRDLPKQVSVAEANEKELGEIRDLISEFCSVFSLDIEVVMQHHFFILRPDSANPYKQLYTQI